MSLWFLWEKFNKVRRLIKIPQCRCVVIVWKHFDVTLLEDVSITSNSVACSLTVWDSLPATHLSLCTAVFSGTLFTSDQPRWSKTGCSPSQTLHSCSLEQPVLNVVSPTTTTSRVEEAFGYGLPGKSSTIKMPFAACCQKLWDPAATQDFAVSSTMIVFSTGKRLLDSST